MPDTGYFLLFFAYLALFGWLLIRIPFFRKSGIPAWIILSIFLVKIIVGLLYAGLFASGENWMTRVDTWRYFFGSLSETAWLKRDPIGFFADLITPRYENDGGMLATQNSLLNDLKEVLIIKWMAICNLFSGSNYAINLIFFNAMILPGQIAIGKLWGKFFRTSPVWPTLLVVFFPSVLFWTSAFHRDGLMLHCLGIITWLAYRAWKNQRAGGWEILLFAVHFVLLFLLRNYLAVFYVIALALAWISLKSGKKQYWMIPLLIFTGMAALWLIGQWVPQANLPSILYQRQQEFAALSGNSFISPLLDGGTWPHLIKAIPEALYRGFMAPFFQESMQLTEWPAAFESLLFLVSIPLALFYYRRMKWNPSARAWLVFVLFLTVIVALITGFTIPYLGAIVRYRSIIMPFYIPLLLFPLLHQAVKVLGRKPI